MDYEHKKGQTEEWIISTKKDRQKNELSAQKRKTERAPELGRKSRAETEKWNKMTAMIFQAGVNHSTFPASLSVSDQDVRQEVVSVTLESAIRRCSALKQLEFRLPEDRVPYPTLLRCM